MKPVTIATLACLLAAPTCGSCDDEAGNCFHDEILAHVRQQFAQYGPMSLEHEYFGFIYRSNEHIDSGVTRNGKCRGGNCLTDTARALAQVPPGARVLGEWHTHPHDGSVQLSTLDIRGARRNRRIRCYVAFYSGPNGEIFSWDPASSSVPVAMASRLALGKYR